MIKEERHKSHILIVVDNILCRTALAFLCEDSGFIVSQADNGEEALSMIDACADEYDLIIVDLEMSRVSGSKLTRDLKKGHIDIPVCVVSGFQDMATFMERLRNDSNTTSM